MEEGRVRAYGPAGEIAERYMNEVNSQALANQAHRAAEPSRRHRRDPLHVGRSRRRRRRSRRELLAPGDTLVVRAAYRAEQRGRSGRCFRSAIVDVDTGLVITTATSRPGDVPGHGRRATGAIECRFPQLPLRAAAVRAAAVDHRQHQLASYDVGHRRPALRGQRPRQRRREPGRRRRRPRVAAVRVRASLRDGYVSSRVTPTPPVVSISIPHGGAAGNVLRTGLIGRLLDATGVVRRSCSCRRS